MQRNRTRLLAIAACGAAIVVAATTWIPTAFAGDTQVQVFDPEGRFERFIDNGKPDFSPGDQIIEIHTLLNPTDGSEAGTIYTEVTILRVVKGGDDFDLTVHCTVVLPEGTILFYGAFRFSGSLAPGGVTLPVTGGTADYELARGTVTIAGGEVDGASGATLTFDLTTT